VGSPFHGIVREMFGELRPGLAVVLEKLGCGGHGVLECGNVNLVLSLPTGYGKSTLSVILARAVETFTFSNFVRVIHVAPTRSLIEDLHDRALRFGVKSAVQFSGAQYDVKAPFFLPRFVITTYDSFMLNMYKAVIAEPVSTYGHFELPRYSIYSSLVHFDEYHLLAFGDEGVEPGGSRAWTALTTTVRQLVNSGVQLMLSTATPSRALEERLIWVMSTFARPGARTAAVHIVNKLGDAVRGRGCGGSALRGNIAEYECEVDGVKYLLLEVEFSGDVPDMETSYMGEGDLVNKVDELLRSEQPCKCSPRVLIVANTVGKAVEWYDKLRKRFGDGVCLMHSRFTVEDRGRLLRRVSEGLCDVLVSTQVIEVGVDLNACSLITELAPIPAIVQRVGRVLRSGSCAKSTGKVFIVNTGSYAPYDGDVVKRSLEVLRENGFRVCWKLPYGCHGKIGYADLLDNAVPDLDLELESVLRSLDEDVYTTRRDLVAVLGRYCSLVRTSALINLYVDGQFPQELSRDVLLNRSLTIDASILYKLMRDEGDVCRVLKCGDRDGVKCIDAIMNKVTEGGRGIAVEFCDNELYNTLSRAFKRAKNDTEFSKNVCRELLNYRRWVEGVDMGLLAIKVVPELYDSEYGLVRSMG